MRFTHIAAVRAALSRAVSDGRYAPATANQHLAALRGALKAAWRLAMVDTDDYLRAVDLRPVAGSRLSAGRDVEQGELGALIEVCRADDRPAGVRDAAVIALAYLSGTRRGDRRPTGRRCGDRPALAAGARQGQQAAPGAAVPSAGPFVAAWLELRGDSPGPLFCRIDRTGSLRVGGGLTGEAIRQLLARRALAAGVARVSPQRPAA